MIRVFNPTTRPKAVKHAGGFRVLLPGESAEVSGDWTQDEEARYRAAGVVLGDPSADPSGAAANDPADEHSSSSTDSVVLGVVAGFAADDESLWTTDGRPDVNAINRALPPGTETISAADRDRIWASRDE